VTIWFASVCNSIGVIVLATANANSWGTVTTRQNI